ncbi:helix-turn-helix domain-containing protein [Caulobacter sp. S45]|uniref:helix-turn-helix domain-containing protein n=1 Tax=Caulobacter sp. S45 TaxID=1641861 RepID=UPI00131B1264|nr:helix-turn-helix domain-containing protein [Caulobacter sp. S45]
MPQSVVPSFFLYGEPPRQVEPRFVHLEALDDRSRPSEWTIRPHAHAELHHLFVLHGGGGQIVVEGLASAFETPTLLVIPAGSIHGFDFEPETAGQVLTIATPFFDELASREPAFTDMFARAGAFALDEEMTDFAELLGRIRRELAWIAPGRSTAVEGAVLGVLVATVRRLQREAQPRPPSRPNRQLELTARFRALVERHWSHRLSIPAYAEQLGASVPKLRAACLAATGEGPLALIQARAMLEAKRLLIYSDLSVSEVAYATGHDDPAYFSRAFTRCVGQPPSTFRSEARR